MKDLFKPVDTIVSPVRGAYEFGKDDIERPLRTTIDVQNIYGITHQVLSNQAFLNIAPINEIDLGLRRASLCKIFENRVDYLFNNSYSLLRANLHNLNEVTIKEFKLKDMVICLSGGKFELERLNDGFKEFFPELYDPRFYFNLEVENFASVPTIVLAITTSIYNLLRVEIHDELKESKIQNIYENITKIFTAFSEAITNDIYTLCSEAHIYGNAGNYTLKENIMPENIEQNKLLEEINSLPAINLL